MYKKILIATFSIRENGQRTAINGMIEPLLSYFLPRADEIDLIDGFHPGSSDVITLIEQYRKKKLKNTKKTFISTLLYPLLKLSNKNSTQLIFKVRDLLSVFEWGLRSGKKYDLFIGLESIYTIGGILLKKIGIVKTVVYYVSDYSPNRYKNKSVNSLYLALDRFCSKHTDYIWDVSPAMHPARIQAGLNSKESKPVILVPNALFPKQINPAPDSKLIPFSLAYAGTLTKSNGPDVAIEAIKIAIHKFPKVNLHIYGSNGADQKRIKELIAQLRLDESVVFHGFIKDAIDITSNINCYMIGLAPYLDIEGSHRRYGDATKLRLYTGAGLPVITTDVPPLGKDVQKYGAGFIVKDTKEDIAKKIIQLFEDKNVYNTARKKAIQFAKNNTWENTYSEALTQMPS